MTVFIVYHFYLQNTEILQKQNCIQAKSNKNNYIKWIKTDSYATVEQVFTINNKYFQQQNVK